MKRISRTDMRALIGAVRTTKHVSGYTHCFYRYPARFSPLLVRHAIEIFTKPGDLVLDPFMGGGTTLVEARTLGRLGLGADINELAVFVARVKTTLIRSSDISGIRIWANDVTQNIGISVARDHILTSVDEPYMRHMRSRLTWRLRRMLQSGLHSISTLPNKRQQDLVRCALLSAGQWALDCRRELPSVEHFRSHLHSRMMKMLTGATEYAKAAILADRSFRVDGMRRTLCINKSAVDLQNLGRIQSYPAPRLIVTSPPYPGVHVLYHRWQIQSRRETALPYWIANCQDGTGSSYYTFGDRFQPGLTKYFEVAAESFTSIRNLCDKRTIVIQLVAFSDPSWQLPEYLRMMEESGFTRISKPLTPDETDPLFRRRVPNRKWYAAAKGNTPSSNEVLLIHRPR